MKVKIQISIAGHIDARYDFAYLPGQVVEVDDVQAQAWIASGIATPTLEALPFTGFDGIPDPLRAVSRPSRKRGK